MAGKTRVQIKIDHKYDTMEQGEKQRTVDTVQTTKGGIAGIQRIGTSPTPIALGSVGTLGNFYFRNDDSTAVIDIGVCVAATFHMFATLQPGQHGTIPAGTTGTDAVYYARSNIANGALWVNIHEA